MNIPASIIKKGGREIEKYAKLADQYDNLSKEINSFEDKLIEAFIGIRDCIGGYLPKEGVHPLRSRFYENLRDSSHIVPSLRRKSPIVDIYATEELLKIVRDLVLDDRVLSDKRDKLKSEMDRMVIRSK